MLCSSYACSNPIFLSLLHKSPHMHRHQYTTLLTVQPNTQPTKSAYVKSYFCRRTPAIAKSKPFVASLDLLQRRQHPSIQGLILHTATRYTILIGFWVRPQRPRYATCFFLHLVSEYVHSSCLGNYVLSLKLLCMCFQNGGGFAVAQPPPGRSAPAGCLASKTASRPHYASDKRLDAIILSIPLHAIFYYTTVKIQSLLEPPHPLSWTQLQLWALWRHAPASRNNALV